MNRDKRSFNSYLDIYNFKINLSYSYVNKLLSLYTITLVIAGKSLISVSSKINKIAVRLTTISIVRSNDVLSLVFQ